MGRLRFDNPYQTPLITSVRAVTQTTPDDDVIVYGLEFAEDEVAPAEDAQQGSRYVSDLHSAHSYTRLDAVPEPEQALPNAPALAPENLPANVDMIPGALEPEAQRDAEMEQ